MVGVLLRLAAFPLAHLTHPELERHWEYATIAKNLIAGNGYSFNWDYANYHLVLPTAYMLPGQVFIIYAALATFGNTLAGHIALFLEEVVLGGVFIFGIGKLLHLLFGRTRAARIGTWLAAIYPSFIVACANFGIASAVLAIDALFLWALVLLLATIRAGERPLLLAIGVGIVAGLMTQFRSESYFLLAVTGVAIVWLYRKSVRKLLPMGTVVVIAALATCAPWVVRNYIVFHKVIPASVNGGFNFWRGHNDLANGSTKNPEFIDWTTPQMWAAMEPLNRLDSNVEFTQDRYDWKLAIDWIRAHPKREAQLALNKVIFFWGIDPYDNRGGVLYMVLYSLTLLAALMGIIRIRRERLWRDKTIRDTLAVIALWTVGYTLVVIAFFSMVRLQVLMIGFYFPLVAYGADSIIAWTFGRFRASTNLGTIQKNGSWTLSPTNAPETSEIIS